MITSEQYFQAKPHTQEDDIVADDLLVRVNALCEEAERLGLLALLTCPNTGTQISGSKGGSGDGGFRLATATTGATNSAHKEAMAVDVYDPAGALDEWLDAFEHGVGDNTMLEQHGLYREAPASTPSWTHLQTRRPRSGRRTFQP